MIGRFHLESAHSRGYLRGPKRGLRFQRHYETASFSLRPNYDVNPDGQRFLMIRGSEQETAATQLNVVLSWSDELRRLAPVGKP
jgi:hypothetical protein